MHQLFLVNARSTGIFSIMMYFPIIGEWYILLFEVHIKAKNMACQNKNQL